MNRSKRTLDLFQTAFADALLVEEYHVVRVFAKDAAGLIFLEDDLVLVDEYLKRGLIGDVECIAHALGDHDTAEVVDFSYDTDRFHNIISILYDVMYKIQVNVSALAGRRRQSTFLAPC